MHSFKHPKYMWKIELANNLNFFFRLPNDPNGKFHGILPEIYGYPDDRGQVINAIQTNFSKVGVPLVSNHPNYRVLRWFQKAPASEYIWVKDHFLIAEHSARWRHLLWYQRNLSGDLWYFGQDLLLTSKEIIGLLWFHTIHPMWANYRRKITTKWFTWS